MELHTCLRNEVGAFDFEEGDFAAIVKRFPQITVLCHDDINGFLAGAARARYLLTWHFRRDWYRHCPALETIFTPAAGGEWVEDDPAGRVRVVHGTFHGRILRESLLGAILFMNRRMPAMVRNFRERAWDRNLQGDCRLLDGQTVMIVGLGHIGAECAAYLQRLGARVVGFKRDPGRLVRPLPGVEVRSMASLDAGLSEADHLVLLLPGGPSTDRLLSLARLRRCREGVYIYNFGRGNALASADLIAAADHIGGAFLDVVDQEPLGASSPLWDMDKVMITPHSSCVCKEYRRAFVDETVRRLEHLPV